jgi:hypothetical protein
MNIGNMTIQIVQPDIQIQSIGWRQVSVRSSQNIVLIKFNLCTFHQDRESVAILVRETRAGIVDHKCIFRPEYNPMGSFLRGRENESYP